MAPEKTGKNEKRVFTLRLNDRVFHLIEQKAGREYRSIANCIEFILLKYFGEVQETPDDDRLGPPP